MQKNRPLVMRVITRLAGGGPPIHATLLNRRLQDYGFDSVLVFGECSAHEINVESLLASTDLVERVPMLGARLNPLRDLVALFQIWRLILRYQPDIVHTHTAKAGFIGRIAAILAGVPHIVHTYHGHVLEGYFGKVLNRVLQLIETLLASHSSALCTVSEQQMQELSNEYRIGPRDKFHVVQLGMDLRPFSSLPAPDYSNAKLTVGWLGRFVPIKNLGLLLDVIQQCEARCLPLQFLVAGDGPERNWVEEEVRSRNLNCVKLLPWQDRIEEMLTQCHLLILTSHREGTPLALIQGMAAGRPFVSTPAGGTVDLATGTCIMNPSNWRYENAVLVKAEPSAFADTFEQLLSDRLTLSRMGTAAQGFALDHFGEQRLLADVASLYENLMEAQHEVRVRS
jgi:glycosyltransferase involved in cell wall biosynthesis